MDVINFSFWSEDEPFVVTYNGKQYTGYFAACACINRALDKGVPLTSAEFMASVTEEQLANVLISDTGLLNYFCAMTITGLVMPLIKDRVKALNEAGTILIKVSSI